MEKTREPAVVSVKRARALRRRQTPAEDIFWREVRNRQFLGLKFRRQVPIGKYIADFVCEREKLIVEIDGASHVDSTDYDEERTRVLEQFGYRVVRYWNSDLYEGLDSVFRELFRLVGGEGEQNEDQGHEDSVSSPMGRGTR